MINHSKYCSVCVVGFGIYHLVGKPCGEESKSQRKNRIFWPPGPNPENVGLTKSQRKNRKKRDAAKVTNPFKTKF